jgi:hypothetical protein
MFTIANSWQVHCRWPYVRLFPHHGQGSNPYFMKFCCWSALLKEGQMPGWLPDSYGFHSDDGRLYIENGREESYLVRETKFNFCIRNSSEWSLTGMSFYQPFGTGSTVGCGIERVLDATVPTFRLFFTHNGRVVGTHSMPTYSCSYFYTSCVHGYYSCCFSSSYRSFVGSRVLTSYQCRLELYPTGVSFSFSLASCSLALGCPTPLSSWSELQRRIEDQFRHPPICVPWPR